MTKVKITTHAGPEKELTDVIHVPDVEDPVRYELESYKKEICRSCRGKGYSTNWHGVTGGADFDYEGGTIEPMSLHIVFCGCERGNQLASLMQGEKEKAQKEILQKIYRRLKKKGESDKSFKKVGIMAMIQGYWDGLQKEKL